MVRPFLFASALLLSSTFLPAVEITRSAVQGEAVFARVETGEPGPQLVAVEFAGKNLPCYYQGDGITECRVAVPADAAVGKQEIKILINGRTVHAGKVRVSAGKFPVEPLRLDAEKKSLVKAGDTEEQTRRIRQALATETPEKIWAGEKFLRPVNGSVESVYGEKRSIDGKQRKGYHRGVDWAAPEGAPIAAPADGKVILAGEFVEEGGMVMLDHGQGLVTAYLHCSKIDATEGQTVKAGETVARAGSTGVANTPHLHFGLYLHGTPIDPLFWFARFGR